MSQSYTLPASGQTGNTALATNVPACLETLRSTWSGTTAPSSPTPVEGQLFVKTNTDELQVYDGAAWRTIAFYTAAITAVPILKDGSVTFTANQAMGGNKLTGLAAATANGDALRYEDMLRVEKQAVGATVTIPVSFTATMNFPVWVAPYAVTVLGAYITMETISGGNLGTNGTDYYTFKLRNVGTGGAGTTDLGSSITNNGTTFTANAPSTLGSISATVNAGEALCLRVEVTGVPTAMKDGIVNLTIYLKNN